MNRPTPDIDPAASPLNARYAAFLEQASQSLNRHKPLYLAGLIASLFFVVLGIALAVKIGFTQNVLSVLLSGVFGALWTGQAFRKAVSDKRNRERLLHLALHGVPVTGYLVQANEALFKPGTDDLPCLVLFSFQPEVDGDPEYMSSLAHRVFSLKNTQNADPDSRRVAEFTTNERAVYYRRRLLPFSFTDGSLVYCADLWIKRAYLPQRHLTTRFLPCFAEIGDEGGLELIPASLLGEPTPPPAPLLKRDKEHS